MKKSEPKVTEVRRTPEMEAKLEELAERFAAIGRMAMQGMSHVLEDPSGEYQISLLLLGLPMVAVPGLVLEDGSKGFASTGTLLFSNIPPEKDFHNAIGTMLEEATEGLARHRKETAN